MTVKPLLRKAEDDFRDFPDEDESSSFSPLWMITHEPVINELVLYLQDARQKIHADAKEAYELRFSHSQLKAVREAFSKVIRDGEKYLHLLCRLFCSNLLETYQIQSVVIGEVVTKNERFTLVQPLSEEELFSATDLDLGTRELNDIKMFDGREWVTPSLVANVVDYQPLESNNFAIHRITSRIKAEEEIWNKVVDEIFNLDTIVSRDKDLRQYSRYVKDIFGIKFVVARIEDVLRLQNKLTELDFSEAELAGLGLSQHSESRKLRSIETKNYLNHSYRKQTGWEAVKSVVCWSEKTFELQIQPLANFLFERERLTKESHSGFKATREDIREQVAQRIPLFKFYRDLLKWLFLNPDRKPPEFAGVTVLVTD